MPHGKPIANVVVRREPGTGGKGGKEKPWNAEVGREKEPFLELGGKENGLRSQRQKKKSSAVILPGRKERGEKRGSA